MIEHKNTCCRMPYDAMLEGYMLLEMMKNAENEPDDHKIIEINTVFEAIVGVSRDEVIGKTVRQVLPESGESWLKIAKNMTQTETAARFEFRLGNTGRHFLISAFNFSHDKTIIFFTETTLEKKVRDAISIHETLFENAQDIMLYIKLDGQIV
ncbi:MAG: PAS domain-containing protein, partial [Bacillota bacterium]